LMIERMCDWGGWSWLGGRGRSECVPRPRIGDTGRIGCRVAVCCRGRLWSRCLWGGAWQNGWRVRVSSHEQRPDLDAGPACECSGEALRDLVRDMVEVLTGMCARLHGQRGARNRAMRGGHRDPVWPGRRGARVNVGEVAV
jgi:hypothetical protein